MDPIKLPERPTLYVTNMQTGEFLGTALAEIDLEHARVANEVRYFKPAGTTFTPPPPVPEGSRARWVNDAWEVVADHRGEIWFAGDRPMPIDFLGDPASRGLSKAPPPPDPALVAAQEQAQAKDKAKGRLNEITAIIGMLQQTKEKIPPELLEERNALIKRVIG